MKSIYDTLSTKARYFEAQKVNKALQDEGAHFHFSYHHHTISIYFFKFILICVYLNFVNKYLCHVRLFSLPNIESCSHTNTIIPQNVRNLE
jgi:hypothetical protein